MSELHNSAKPSDQARIQGTNNCTKNASCRAHVDESYVVQVIAHWGTTRTAPLSSVTLTHILEVAKRNTHLRGDVDPSEAELSTSDESFDGSDSWSSSTAAHFEDEASAALAQAQLHRADAAADADVSTASETLHEQLRAQLAQLRSLPRSLSVQLQALRMMGSAAASEHIAPHKVSLSDAPSFQFPNQQNRLALVMDPVTDRVPFTFGVEIFPPGHRTTPHVHTTAHEMFFIVSGAGEAFCNGTRFRVGAGDTVVFPPGCEHGIDADAGQHKLYCLELMLPNEEFSELVRAGQKLEGLGSDDMCILAAIGCK